MVKSGKLLNIIMWALLLISAILIISLVSNISENVVDSIMGNWINTNLIWAYILLIVLIVIVLVSGILSMVTDIQTLKSGLLVIGFFVVIWGISYVISSAAIPQFLGVDKFVADGTLTPRISRMIEAGLYVAYILFFLAIVSVAWTSVSRLIK